MARNLLQLLVNAVRGYFSRRIQGHGYRESEEKTMKSSKLITAFLLMLPAAAWAPTPPPETVPEPGILPLLALGGVLALAVAIVRRRK